MTRLIFIILSVLCLCACKNKPYPQSLVVADSLANVQPDSAIALLSDLKAYISAEPEATQKYYQLLCIKANDKAYIRHTSDSLILPVLQYYIKKNDNRHLPEAYYYAGRVYRDLEDAPQALKYFEKAIESSPKDKDYKIKSKIYSQMGTLFLYQKAYDEALKMFKEARKCNIEINDSASIVFNLRDIADSYRCLNQKDSALIYYQRAYDLANNLESSFLKAMVQSQIASLYVELEKYDFAQQALQPSLDNLDHRAKSGIYSIASELYHKTGRIDSATYYYKELLQCGTIYAKQAAHEGLAEIAIEHHNPKEALLHLRQFIECTDSIRKITDTETIRQLNSIYNYQWREKENSRLKAENEAKEKILIYIVLVCLFIFISSFAYLQYNRRKRLQLMTHLDKLEQLKEEQYRKSSQFIEEKKREIEELKLKLQEADHANQDLMAKLEEQIELTICANKQAEIEFVRRQQAGAILLKSEIYYHIQKQLDLPQTSRNLLSNQDWEELEEAINDTYQGFTENLRKICSLNEHEYHVCLLIKINLSPIQISKLTLHSKEAISSTRRRLYKKVFCKQGTPKDWDNFILSL